jgi:hypothetical protein
MVKRSPREDDPDRNQLARRLEDAATLADVIAMSIPLLDERGLLAQVAKGVSLTLRATARWLRRSR